MSLFCNTFAHIKFEIINILMNKRGYSYNDAVAKQVKSLVTFDQEIYDIMNELIHGWQNQGYEGVPTLIGRNPDISY